jgi:hypothetical protein
MGRGMGEVSSKFQNLPTINYINLHSSVDRMNFMETQFALHEVSNYKRYAISPFKDYQTEVTLSGQFVDSVMGQMGTIISFLRCIKNWYDTTDEPYGIFLEDDTSFEMSKYWNFSLSDFFNALPENWECVQLIRVHDWRTYKGEPSLKCRQRNWDDWGATCAMTRGYAKKIIDAYIVSDNSYNIELLYSKEVIPVIESMLFVDLGNVLNAPLFLEHNPTVSTYTDRNFIGQFLVHWNSREIYKKTWEQNGLNTSLLEFMGE